MKKWWPLSVPVWLMFVIMFSALSAHAIVDGHEYPFDNPEDAERFTQLAEELRCPKCQNQNLADSNAPIAKDLRNKVYEQVLAGNSNEEIVDYLVARYGDFVRYKPAFELHTAALWLTPVLLFLVALIVFIRITRNKSSAQPLSSDEAQQLEKLRQDITVSSSGRASDRDA